MAGFLLSPEVGQDCLDIWLDILRDALESPEDQSAAIDHLQTLSRAALVRGSIFGAELSRFFDFGVQLQWEVVLYRKGRQRAATEFMIDFDGEGDDGAILETFAKYFKKDESSAELVAFTDRVVSAYESHIGEAHPKWKLDFKYMRQLFKIAGAKWADIPALTAIPLDVLEFYKANATKDSDGLYTDNVTAAESEIERENIFTLFSLLQKLHGNQWKKSTVIEGPCGRVLTVLCFSWNLEENSRGVFNEEQAFT